MSSSNSNYPYSEDIFYELSNLEDDAAQADTIKEEHLNDMLASLAALKSDVGTVVPFCANISGDTKVAAFTYRTYMFRSVDGYNPLIGSFVVPQAVIDHIGADKLSSNSVVALVDVRPDESDIYNWSASTESSQVFTHYWNESGNTLYIGWANAGALPASLDRAIFIISVIFIG